MSRTSHVVATHTHPLAFTGKVLNRPYELREELRTLKTGENSAYFKLTAYAGWCAKLAYLDDILRHVSELNAKMQDI